MSDQVALPFSGACERNKQPILNVLKQYLASGRVLEMGHGTGQHAEYFSTHLPVKWQPADREENLWIVRERLGLEPLSLEVSPKASLKDQLKTQFDHIFTANTLHIMPESAAFQFCEEVAEVLKDGGYLLIYGPFKWDGEFSSESNAQFDQSLKSRDSQMGIREFKELKKRLEKNHICFIRCHDLPANNHLLAFQRHNPSKV